MTTPARHLTVSELRGRIARLEGHRQRAKPVLPFGIPDLDARLPGGGLALGALHEVAGGGNGAVDGAAAALFTLIRAEGRAFPSHRCFARASESRHRSRGKHYRISLADGDWFYFAGIWRPATRDWPEAFAIVTIEASADVAPFHDRQMAVVLRDQRLAWLDRTSCEKELLRPLPAGTFKVARHENTPRQAELAF